MIIKTASGENKMYINFAELAVNEGYSESILNLFKTRAKEIEDANANSEKIVEKPIQVYVKTSDTGVCKLGFNGKDQLDVGDLEKFLEDVHRKLRNELIKDAVKDKIDDLDKELEKLEVDIEEIEEIVEEIVEN